MAGADLVLVLVLELAEGGDAERGQDRVVAEREAGREGAGGGRGRRGRGRGWGGRWGGGGVGFEGRQQGGRQQAAGRVGVGGVEGTRPPQQVANVHEEAVEGDDVRPRLGRHRLDRDLLPRQDGAEPRQRRQRRRHERQQVDSQRRRCGHGHGHGRVCEQVRHGFVVRQRHRQHARCGRVAAQQRQRQHRRVPRERFDRRRRAWVGRWGE